MRHWARLAAFGAATGIAVCAVAGCGLKQTAFTDDATLTQPVTSVALDGAGGGAVTVRGSAGATQVSVHRVVTYQGLEPPTGTSFRVDNGALTLGDCGPHCWVDYTLDVPLGLPVDGSNHDGAVRLSSVGAVDVTTDDGAIEVDDVRGAVQVRSDEGAITGRGLDGGAVTATTNNARIELTLQKPQDVVAKSSDGAVTVVVPTDRYRVSTSTDDGKVDVAMPNDPSGTHRIDLTTDDGAITLRAAAPEAST